MSRSREAFALLLGLLPLGCPLLLQDDLELVNQAAGGVVGFAAPAPGAGGQDLHAAGGEPSSQGGSSGTASGHDGSADAGSPGQGASSATAGASTVGGQAGSAGASTASPAGGAGASTVGGRAASAGASTAGQAGGGGSPSCGSAQLSESPICPATCDRCELGFCIMECSGQDACKDRSLACPDGVACRVECHGKASCSKASISCPRQFDCALSCLGEDACKDAALDCDGNCTVACDAGDTACESLSVQCGVGRCAAACGADKKPPVLQCAEACECTTCR